MKRLSFYLLFVCSLVSENAAQAYEIWVTNQGANKVHVFDGGTLKEVATITTDVNPTAVEFSTDFKYAFVSNFGSGTMTVIGAASRQKVATVHTGSGAHSVSPSPDGKYVLVPNAGDATVSVVTIPSFKVQTTLHVDAVPMAVVFSADGSTAYLAHAGGTLTVIDMKKKTVAGKVRQFDGGFGIARSPDGSQVYLAGGFQDTVAIVDVRTRRLRSKIAAGRDAHAVFRVPDGTGVWIVNRLSGSIAVVANGDDRITRQIENVGDRPDMVAFGPDGRAFVTLHGQVPPGYPSILSGSEPGFSVLDAASGALIGKVRLDGDPHGIAIRQTLKAR